MTADHRRRDERVAAFRQNAGESLISRVLAKRGYIAAVAVTLSLSLLPWLFAADGPAPPQREANRQRLSGMTAAERQRLKENYDLYREMTPAERDRLRRLQREIDSDQELTAAFHEYQLWADSLSPVDRHELRQAQDPEARRQLIEKFRRRPPPGEMPEPFPSERRPDGPPFGQNNNIRQRAVERLFGEFAMPLADRMGTGVAEMEAIIRVLERELPAESRDELKQLDDFSRKVRVLKLCLERRPLAPPSVRLFGPGSEVIDKVFAALPDGPVRQFAGNRNSPPNPRPNQPDPRGAMLVMVMVRGLVTETLRTIEDHRPRNELLMAQMEKLSESERTRLNALNFKDREQELVLLIVKEQVPGIAELQQLLGNPDMRRFLEDMTSRIRPGSGPPDGDDRRDKKGRPGPFDGTRRPRDPDSPLPPNRPEPKD